MYTSGLRSERDILGGCFVHTYGLPYVPQHILDAVYWYILPPAHFDCQLVRAYAMRRCPVATLYTRATSSVLVSRFLRLTILPQKFSYYANYVATHKIKSYHNHLPHSPRQLIAFLMKYEPKAEIHRIRRRRYMPSDPERAEMPSDKAIATEPAKPKPM